MSCFWITLNRTLNWLPIPTDYLSFITYNYMVHLLDNLTIERITLVDPYSISRIFRILPTLSDTFFVRYTCPPKTQETCL